VIRFSQTQIGETVDLGWVAADAAAAQRYWQAAGLPCPGGPRGLPLGMALALRGGPSPAVELAPETVGFHAGHTLSAQRPFVPDRRYRLLARVAEVFEKSGRSGPLTVIVRTAELRDEADAVVVSMREEQIVRWRGSVVAPPAACRSWTTDGRQSEGRDGDLDIGATIGVIRRRAPDAETVRNYAGSLGGREPLFSDRQFARRVGLADVIVPGPMQSALFEGLLADNLPGWDLTDLSLTFRVSVLVDEPIALTALVTEMSPQGGCLVADLTLENSSGERAAAGVATLVAPPEIRAAGA
jgi:acyl dehydratase